jgi:drug/metabolite transporter (DMT)-like permease
VRGERRTGVLLVAGAATLWGGWALVLRPAGLPSLPFAFTVLLVMAAPLPFALRLAPWRDRGAVAALLLLGAAEAGNLVLYFAAIERGPVAVAVLTHYLAPLLVTLAAPWVTGERASRRARLAAPISLLGLGLLVWQPGAGAPIVTAALGAGSAVFYAVIVFAARRAGRAFRPVEVMTWHAVVSAALLLAWYGPAALPPASTGTLLVVGGALVCGVLGSLLFYRGVGLVPAPVVGALTYLEPLTAALVGWAAFGEALGGRAMLGAALVLAGGVAVALEPAPPGAGPPP